MSRSEPPAESHAALAERIRSGTDPSAESELIERYARGTRILLARHTRDPAEAEDLFQETFRLAVVKLRAGELRNLARLPAFLASLARNLATEHYRKAGRRQTEPNSEAVDAASTVPGGQLNALLRDEEAALVRRTIDELSTDRDREILFRFYIAEEDKDVISADHALTSVQFNRVLHRARQRYKQLYLARLAARDGGPAHAIASHASALINTGWLGGVVILDAIIRSLVSLRG